MVSSSNVDTARKTEGVIRRFELGKYKNQEHEAFQKLYFIMQNGKTI